MKTTLFTMYEGTYHYGVAALINSALTAGFTGNIVVFFKGELPPWTKKLKPIGSTVFEVNNCTITFYERNVSRHFGYDKPAAALDVFSLDPACEAVVYADPDVVLLAPWWFIEEWITNGVALCLDVNFPFLAAEHPWRRHWGHLLTTATGKMAKALTTYPNSGFFGIGRSDAGLLRDWAKITDQFESEGGEINRFLSDRCLPVNGDQDLLSAALMGWDGRVSILGLEGMGFNHHYFIMSHHVARPKPWALNFVWQSIKGETPSQTSALFLSHANHPIAAYSKPIFALKKLSYRLAQLISRVWKR